MKKLVSIILALALCLSAVIAVAEEAAFSVENEVEVTGLGNVAVKSGSSAAAADAKAALQAAQAENAEEYMEKVFGDADMSALGEAGINLNDYAVSNVKAANIAIPEDVEPADEENYEIELSAGYEFEEDEEDKEVVVILQIGELKIALNAKVVNGKLVLSIPGKTLKQINGKDIVLNVLQKKEAEPAK